MKDEGLGFRVNVLGFRVQGSGKKGFRLRISGAGFGIQSLEFGV